MDYFQIERPDMDSRDAEQVSHRHRLHDYMITLITRLHQLHDYTDYMITPITWLHRLHDYPDDTITFLYDL